MFKKLLFILGFVSVAFMLQPTNRVLKTTNLLVYDTLGIGSNDKMIIDDPYETAIRFEVNSDSILKIYEDSVSYYKDLLIKSNLVIDGIANDVLYVNSSGAVGGFGSVTPFTSFYPQCDIYASTGNGYRLHNNPNVYSPALSFMNGDSVGFNQYGIAGSYGMMLNIDGDTLIIYNIDSISNFKVINFNDKAVFKENIEAPFESVSFGTPTSVDFSTRNYKVLDITGDVTVNISNQPEGISTLVINQDGTGRTITIGTGWGTILDNSPLLSSTANAKNIVQFINDGTDISYVIQTVGN